MVYVFRLAVNDLKNIVRDKFLVYAAIALPILVIAISQIFVLWIGPALEETYPLIFGSYKAIFLLCTSMLPLVYGFISAFLILDEKMDMKSIL
jgi:hypothetical protein